MQTLRTIRSRPRRRRRRLAEPDAAQAPAPQTSFSRAELEKLLAPIALYPDSLLAQILPASAYPIQIVQVHRWLDRNADAVAKNDYSAIDGAKYDPAVKALARFPDVINKMSENLDWTTDLGDAFVNQPKDVADVIQDLRAKAETAGTLKTTAQQTVTSSVQDGQNIIAIAPTDPSMVYVPSYDPVEVYQPYTGVAPLLTYGAAAVAVGAIFANNYWNWGTGWVRPPVWPGYGGWRAPYAGWRPGSPVVGGGNIINTGNINAGNRWRPGGDYRPGLGSKPGIGGAGRPGGVGGPGGRAASAEGAGRRRGPAASAGRASRRRGRPWRRRRSRASRRRGRRRRHRRSRASRRRGRPSRRRRGRASRRRRRRWPSRRRTAGDPSCHTTW